MVGGEDAMGSFVSLKMKALSSLVKVWAYHRSWRRGKAPKIKDEPESLGLLTDRLGAHFEKYADLQMMLSNGAQLECLKESEEIVAEAGELAFEISLIPGYRDIPPFARVHRALTRHWQCRWLTGGISITEYRTSIKAAILFIRRLGCPAPLAEVESYYSDFSR